MKKIFIITIIIITSGLGIYWQLHKGHDEHNNKESHEVNEKVKKALYICPMHPQIRSDKPGQTCSICGMDLVPASDFEEHKDHDHEEHDKVNGNDNPDSHAEVKLPMSKQQMIGVKLDRVRKEKLFKSVNAPGRIAFDPELYTAQSEYLEALKQWSRVKESPLSDVRKSTSEMIRSTKIRLKVLGLSEGQIKQLTRRGSQSEGLLVSGKGQESWVYADVFEVDLPQIKKGLSAQITANFLQGKILAGEVISVDQVINPETRTAKVRISLKDTDAAIRPESYVNVKILSPQGEHLSIPVDALMDTGRDTFVFVKVGEGKFEPKRVTVLLETDDRVAVGSGLSENDEIVVGGNFMLDSESRLKAVLRGNSASGGHNH